MITPPVGMNLFTIKAITNADFIQIVKGCAPYVLLMLLALLLVFLFPQLALWLPELMMSK